MKAACLALAMIGCAVLIQGTSYAFSLSPASQEQSTDSSTKQLSGDHPTSAASPHDGERQKDGATADQQRTRRRTPKKNFSHTHANPIKANRPKQVRNGRERSTSENVKSVAQPSPSKPAVGTAKIASIHNLPVRGAGLNALNGQQFKNPRKRPAAPATVGGPASPTKRTEAISGTGMNRKRLN